MDKEASRKLTYWNTEKNETTYIDISVNVQKKRTFLVTPDGAFYPLAGVERHPPRWLAVRQ
jgi:hypothetical protein